MSKVPTEEDVLGTRMISEDNVTKEMRQEVNLVFVYFSLVAPDTEKRNESRTSDELESKLLRLLTGKIDAGIEKVIRLKKKSKKPFSGCEESGPEVMRSNYITSYSTRP